ncbi:glutathione synthetase [Candidatus Photodesmus blepharus]|uniref:Glutathione synthetase n=1 Tax=Candidatus Photodesmus blepharonis TaxID=1179155 RepID=A0A084CM25_9GAMM|nr:glutathione synthase [Candidatus Photodesmus blepharus]KEY90854.1 glutathione synthetase [Candidatus Photodesmus blepharus]
MIKLGILMDCIKHIDTRKNSCFAMMLEAQRRGYEIHYMEIDDLHLEKNIAIADTKIVKLKDNVVDWYQFKSEQTIELSELDVILMRKDPPVDKGYICATYILEQAAKQGTLIINKPQSLRDCNEKLFATWFPELIPSTVVTRKIERIKAFQNNHDSIILKPLDGMGGSSVFWIKKNDPNFSVIVETLTNNGKRYTIVQEFVPDITNGDKRVLVIDGEPFPYCLARIPAIGETRGNLTSRASGEVRLLNKSDIRIVQAVSPTLKKKGLIFVGLDIIGDKLTEINVTSPTCVREIERTLNVSITGKLMDVIERRLKNYLK